MNTKKENTILEAGRMNLQGKKSRMAQAIIAAMVLQLIVPAVGSAKIAQTTSVDNPPLVTESCGLDIALVMDNSGSIGNNLGGNPPAAGTMKSAFDSFVNTLVPATPTNFSVTYFNTRAHYALQNFNNSASIVTGAINTVPVAGGSTNWEDGLIKAQATLAASGSKPNLVIFASDGEPNKYGAGGYLEGPGYGFDQTSLNRAITEANIIKGTGTRIITLGIGSSVNQTSLEAISSSDAYYSVANFNDLATALQNIAIQLCGGTITVTKLIDDGQGHSTPAANWQFTVGNQTKTTNSDGQANFIIDDAGTYSISETAQSGFGFVSASCTPGGQQGSNGTVSGVQVDSQKIVNCTFHNTPYSHVIVKKNVVPATDDTIFNFNTVGSGYNSFSLQNAGTNDSGPLQPGTYAVAEAANPNYISTAVCDNGQSADNLTLGYGQTVTCLFTNTRKGGITITKVTNPDQDPTQFTFHPSWDNVFTLTGVAGSNSVNFASVAPNATSTPYSITEDVPAGWVQSNVECKDEQNNILSPSTLVLNPSGSIACTFGNTKYGSIVVTKNTVGGDGEFGFNGDNGIGTFNISTSGQTGTKTISNLLPNTYSITETSMPNANWAKTGSDCDRIVVAPGETKTCTVTNTFTAPTQTGNLKVTKIVSGGTASASEFSIHVKIDGGEVANSPQPGNSEGTTYSGLQIGTYNVGETGGPANYVSSFGGNCDASGNVLVSNGQTANCTITNTFAPPSGSPQADVALTKTVDHASLISGQQAIFTIGVSNSGPDTATNVVVTDALPAGLLFVSATSTAGTYSTITNNWTVGSLASGQSASLSIAAIVSGTQGTQIVNQVSVTIDPNIDINSSNNHASSVVLIVAEGGSNGGGGSGSGSNTSIGGGWAPGYGSSGGGVAPQVAGASTERMTLDEILAMIENIKKQIAALAAQIAAMHPTVLGAATMIKTGVLGF